MASDQSIRITDTGPLLVTGGVPLVRRAQAETIHGEPVEWDTLPLADAFLPENPERYALCRCGHSSQKPFCDGTHANTPSFDPALTASREFRTSREQVQTAGDGTLADDQTMCADAGYCGTRFTNVWDMAGDLSDPEVRARFLRMVESCPSGRIVFRDAAGRDLEPEFAAGIAVVPNGPLWVRGRVVIESADRAPFETRNRVTLCRCGASQNKPFCDGAHKSVGFKAD